MRSILTILAAVILGTSAGGCGGSLDYLDPFYAIEQDRKAKAEAEWQARLEANRRELEAKHQELENRRRAYVDSHPELTKAQREGILSGDGIVWIGMSEEALLVSIGREPDHRHRTVTRFGVSEQWVYGSFYVYLEDGKVDAWQTE